MRFQKGQVAWNKGKPNTWYNPKGLKLGLGWNKGGEAEWVKGDKNPNYGKFGKKHPRFQEIKVHRFHKQIRETFKYRQWRSDVFTRDNFTCQHCQTRGIELNADHYPKRFIDIIKEYKINTLDSAINCDELWNINNGRTLCVSCHRKTDTWGHKGHKKSSLIDSETQSVGDEAEAESTVRD